MGEIYTTVGIRAGKVGLIGGNSSDVLYREG
jgi:hypothetical protein